MNAMILINDNNKHKFCTCVACLPTYENGTSAELNSTVSKYYYNEGAIAAGWLRALIPEYSSTVQWYCPSCAKGIAVRILDNSL